LVLTLLLIAMPIGCSGQGELPPPTDTVEPGTASIAIEHPLLEGLDPDVVQRIGDVRRIAESNDTADAYGRLGMFYQAHDFPPAARASYLQAVRRDPSAGQWHYFLGLLARRAGRHDDARQHFGRVLELEPADLPSTLWIAEMALTDNDYDAAARGYRQALERRPESVAALFGLGRVALAREDHDAAIRHLQAGLVLAPDASALHYPLALAYRGRGEVDQAREQMELRGARVPQPVDPRRRALQELTDGTRVHQLRGTLLFEEGRFEEAREQFEAAQTVTPEDPLPHTNLGRTLIELGDLPGARSAFERAIELAPQDPTAHFNLGTLLSELGDDEGAIEHHSVVVSAHPDWLDARYNLANSYRRTGRHAAALPHYRAVIEGDPGRVGAYLAEAFTLIRLEREAEARGRLEEAHRALPEDLSVRNALVRLLAGASDTAVRDPRQALGLARQLQGERLQVEYATTLAMVAASIGQFQQAVALQQQVIIQVRSAGLNPLLPALEANLAGYRQGRAASEPWPRDHPLLTPTGAR